MTSSPTASHPPNALQYETSPYLLQHAHNPVDWRPWGEAAFAEARRRDVPVFLSVGYSTCYWCHVMEREVFEDAALVGPLNEQFVCIKVDREERPDVDELYMLATQLLTGSGGWPMNVFLTPPQDDSAQGLLPFWAGTYIPPRPLHGRAGFAQVIESLGRAWTQQRDEVLEQGQRVAAAVREQLADGMSSPAAVDTETLANLTAELMRRYDPQHGGFGGGRGPKFPTPTVSSFLWHMIPLLENSQPVADAVEHTLEAMARGGMFDQVGGGFHRYSVDEKWLVPHFEKMLYDQGQLLELYATAAGYFQVSPNQPLFERVVRQTADYLLREMRETADEVASGGAFWSAQDAEVNTREGENYLWNPQQVRDALAEEPDAAALARFALDWYGLTDGTNFCDPHDADAPPSNVLHEPQRVDDFAQEHGVTPAQVQTKREQVNGALLKARNNRPQPGTDDKVLTGWNGLAIAGLVAAGRVLEEPRYLAAAAEAAERIWDKLHDEDLGLLRTMRQGRHPTPPVPGFLDDYAFYLHGLLALAAGDTTRWLPRIRRLMDEVGDRFAVNADHAAGYFDTPVRHAALFARMRSTYDGALPAPGSQMMHNLVDLYALTGESVWLDQALAQMQLLGKALQTRGVGLTHAASAAVRLLTVSPKAREKMLAAACVSDQSAEPAPVMARLHVADAAAHRYEVTLDIAEGFHLYPPAAVSEGLQPVELFAANVSLDVDWPAGHQERAAESADRPPVYQGSIRIDFVASQPVEQVTLRYQPCREDACLAVQTLVLHVGG